MYGARYIATFYCLSLLFFIQTAYCAVTLSSLDIPLQQTFFNMTSGVLTCGATKSGAGEQALVRSYSAGMPFAPCAPKTVTLNNVADAMNPLFDKEIIHISGMICPDAFGRPGTERILAVTAQEPAMLILVDIAAQQAGTFVRSVDAVYDATGKKSGGIIALEGTQGTQNGAFVAVKPSQGSFGDAGSGIALVSFGSKDIEKDKKKSTEWHFNQVNLDHNKNIVTACPIDVTTKALAIGSNVARIGEHVALHWNGILNRLFVGLDVTAGSGCNDGACALLVGSVDTHSCPTPEGRNHSHRCLNFEPCVPHDAVVDTTSALVATRGADSRAVVHYITTFKTSTDLWYIAMVGSCSDPDISKQTVYAIPLNVDETQRGTFAKFEQEPVTFFGPKEYPTFRARLLRSKVDTADHLSSPHNRVICVGGGPLDAGPIETITVVQDTLFAVVAGKQPNAGVYHSQALLDDKGLIKGWTRWRQVYRSDDYLLQSAFYDKLGGSFTSLSHDDNTQTLLKKTVWGSGDIKKSAPLVSFLRDTYTKDISGIRAYADIPVGTPGFAYQSCMAVGGYQALTLAIMAEQDAHGTLHYTQGEDFKISDRIIHYTGGTLTSLGTVEAITSAATDTDAWLFAGGTGGLAVYVSDNGTGWDPYVPLDAENMRKKIGVLIGDYKFVRRLLHDENYLYVLTDDTLDRIDLTQSIFDPNNTYLAATTLAQRAAFPSFNAFGLFTDIIVSGKAAFLATSGGLYRVGDTADIRSADSAATVNWTKVLPVGDDPIVHLGAQSVTGRVTDVARYGGGNLFVVQGYIGRNHGTVKRLSVKDCTDKVIDNTTIATIPDIRIENAPTMFRRIGSFTPQCATDGALWLYIRKESPESCSLYSMTDIYPMHDVSILFHNTHKSKFSFVQRFESSQGAWWALGQSVVVNE